MHQYELDIRVKETKTVVTEHTIEGVVLNSEQYENLLKILNPSGNSSSVTITKEESKSILEDKYTGDNAELHPMVKDFVDKTTPAKSDRRSKYTYDDDYILAELAKGRKESSIAKELNIPYQTFHNHVVKIKESSSQEDSKEDVQ